jgi:hypothetical protein
MARSRCSAPSGLRVAQRGEGACSGRQPVLKAMLITAPEGLKEGLKSELRALSPQPSWLRRFRGFGRGREPLRCGSGHQVRAALGVALRYQRKLSEEISELDEQLDRLVAEAAPELLRVEGVSTVIQRPRY